MLSFSENFSSLDLLIKKSKSIIFLYLKAKNDSCPSNLNIECYTKHPSEGRNVVSSTYKPTNLQTYKITNLQTYKPTNLQPYKPTNLQTYKPKNLKT